MSCNHRIMRPAPIITPADPLKPATNLMAAQYKNDVVVAINTVDKILLSKPNSKNRSFCFIVTKVKETTTPMRYPR